MHSFARSVGVCVRSRDGINFKRCGNHLEVSDKKYKRFLQKEAVAINYKLGDGLKVMCKMKRTTKRITSQAERTFGDGTNHKMINQFLQSRCEFNTHDVWMGFFLPSDRPNIADLVQLFTSLNEVIIWAIISFLLFICIHFFGSVKRRHA